MSHSVVPFISYLVEIIMKILIDKTSAIYLYLWLKDTASFFFNPVSFRTISALYECE
jgi:hypothetical protein